MRLGRYSQSPDEVIKYSIDYTDWLGTGEVVSSVAYTVTPTTSPALQVTNDSVAGDGLTATFFLSGGITGRTYTVSAIADTDGGQSKEVCIYVSVQEC